jgi:cytochrome c556
MALVAIVATGVAISAQKNPYRNYTEEKFVQNMQAADRNYAAVKALIAKSDYESAKAQLTRAREQMAITITFWRDANNQDAVAMLRKTLTGMDDLDIALGAEHVDPSAIAAASEHIGAACQACHGAYREQDPSTKAYRVRRWAQ